MTSAGWKESTLGRSGLVVSRIGLGLAALGRPGYINLGHAEDLPEGHAVDALKTRASAVLDVAKDEGIRYFDAARSYGRAEAFLAAWFDSRGIKPGEITVGSKWGYTYTADWKVNAEKHEVKDHSVATLNRQEAETRATLGPFLNLYQIHSATIESGVLDDLGVCERLAELKRSGWRVGLSVSGPGQAETIKKALNITEAGGANRLFDCVQATWNLLERSAGLALAEASAAGLGVIVKEGLANGRLTDRNEDSRFVDSRRIIQAEADRLETTADALALAAVLAEPWADVVLSGAATAEQLRSNLRALDVAWDDQAAEALASLLETPDEYWQVRARLPWN